MTIAIQAHVVFAPTLFQVGKYPMKIGYNNRLG